MTKALRQSSNATQELAKQWLTKGGIFHEDSDDELGSEDLPWEWIYDSNDVSDDNSHSVPSSTRRRIIGARMGSFECKIGQPVLLKSPEPGKDWAGIICEFLEEAPSEEVNPQQDGLVKSANIMWFASPDEFISTRKKKRLDALPNEQYITVDFNVNPLTSINGKAIVLSKDAFYAKYPNGEPPKGRSAIAEYNKSIICRRGVNQLQGRYTEEFIWEDIYRETEEGVLELIQRISTGLKKPRKRKAIDSVGGTDSSGPVTPKKQQKIASVTGPSQSGRHRRVLRTPTQKRIFVKKPLEFTPLETRVLSTSQFTSSPYRQARNLLHVSSVPTSLPCRDGEFQAVYHSLRSAITDGTGTCIYISGPPGTGKTATVREVISHLNAAVLAEEMDDFIFVEINGMKLTDPHQSYSLLWEALKGDRVSPSHALSLLEREFSRPSPRRVPCVVLMDELDQLVTRNQSIIYNFFNWPALRHSHLVVLAVANTMDLPERTLSNKISSRLGLTRITFSGYKHQELMEIIGARLENVPGNIVSSDAIQFASRKVAAVSGDARRALDICRRAVEIAERASSEAMRARSMDKLSQDDEDTHSLPPTPSRGSTRRMQGKDLGQHKDQHKECNGRCDDLETVTLPRVTIATIKQAIQEAISTPLRQSLRCLPLAAKILLSGMLAWVRRTGVVESNLGDVLDEAKRMADCTAVLSGCVDAGLNEFLNNNRNFSIPGMGYAAAELTNAGIITIEGQSNGKEVRRVPGQVLGKVNRSGKIRLRIAPEDVAAVLRDDIETKILGLVFEG
ncbi:hypothetical protein VTO42DRAFT_9015 [Malbranchea cinnamomea]